MTRFHLEIRYDADPDAVARAYADPALYDAFADLPRAGPPEVLGRADRRRHRRAPGPVAVQRRRCRRRPGG